VEDFFLLVPLEEFFFEADAGFCFPCVIAFPAEFGAGVGDGFVEEEAFWEELAGCEEEGEVGEVRVDAVSYSGVLDFDGDLFVVGF
jgi:hypothetical protein